MDRLVADDEPDPDGDRRFDERPFPLLEPIAWTGERHRGGYGVRDPGSVTTGLELIFGPWSPYGAEPRVAIGVASELVTDLRDRDADTSARIALAASPEEMLRPAGTDVRFERALVHIVIEDEPVEFLTLTSGDRWIGQGSWNGLTVQIRATLVEPADLRLRVASEFP